MIFCKQSNYQLFALQEYIVFSIAVIIQTDKSQKQWKPEPIKLKHRKKEKVERTTLNKLGFHCVALCGSHISWCPMVVAKNHTNAKRTKFQF